MKFPPSNLLVINVGSSSIRFSVYDEISMASQLSGKIDRIGLPGMEMTVLDSFSESPVDRPISIPSCDFVKAAGFLLEWISEHRCFPSIRAVGHRVVHGMKHTAATPITNNLLAELHSITPYVPEHLPQEIMLIEAFQNRHPDLPQYACFDTSFHQNMPKVAKLLPIPRRYSEQGVERYGFHGLSYSYLMEELARLDTSAKKRRVILAHLGNGASLAALANGESIDTSMGFTPASGLMMSTRSGDLDPGLFSYLAHEEKMTAEGFQTMVNKESGLLGISETSSDLGDLLDIEATDIRAAEAVAMFCYQVKMRIGSFAAALGGLDSLVFSGGIGENSPVIRERICDGLGFLGIELNEFRNTRSAAVISTDAGQTTVRVIPTDEELMIARSACL
ncbi:MAG: acetate kinase [Cryomorphaceae bacterium]|jgi:acetate kinase